MRHETISQTLLRKIKQSKESHYQIAKEAGVPEGTLSRFLSGERTIKLETAERLCQYFRLRLN